MFTEEWLGFGYSVVLQVCVYLALVKYHSSFRFEVKKLPWYLLSGVVVGVLYDYLFGLEFGFWNYSLGFTPLFIVLNGFFLWGLFIAEVATLRKLSFFGFAVSCVIIGYVTELSNMYVQAWEWTLLENPLFEYLVVVHFLYPGFGLLVVLCMNSISTEKFTVLNIFK